MPDTNTPLDAVLIGRLQRDYILPFQRPEQVGILGGSLPYTAAALAHWGGRAALISRVNADYPVEWLQPLQELGSDLSGIHLIPEPIDTRRFVAFTDPVTPHYENPLTWFADRQTPFPAELLGYNLGLSRFCSKTDYLPYSFRITDLPYQSLELSAAHIGPVDYISHKILPSILKGGLIQTLTLRSTPCYMDPSYWEDMRGLLSDLTAFQTTEAEVLKLFQGRSVDVWEIAQALAAYGPEFVIINMKDGSAAAYDRVTKKKWQVPAWPGAITDPTGMQDAFDGAFLLNYRKEYDLVEGLLCGQISAAICGEGSGPFYMLGSLPGLKEVRLETLRPRVRAV